MYFGKERSLALGTTKSQLYFRDTAVDDDGCIVDNDNNVPVEDEMKAFSWEDHSVTKIFLESVCLSGQEQIVRPF